MVYVWYLLWVFLYVMLFGDYLDDFNFFLLLNVEINMILIYNFVFIEI